MMKQRNVLSAALLTIVAAASPLLAFGQAHTGHEMSNTDRQFVAQAMKENEEELASAKVESTSSDHSVKTYAQTVYRDHEKALVHLEALAKQYNLKYPAPGPAPKPLPPHQYMQQEVADHQKAIALYEDEIKHGLNTSIKQYAIATLPVLKQHLAMAQQYAASGH